MKKAFSLAEILVCLTIVGLMAGALVPRLIKNVNQEVFTTSGKKAYSMLSNVYDYSRNKNNILIGPEYTSATGFILDTDGDGTYDTHPAFDEDLDRDEKNDHNSGVLESDGAGGYRTDASGNYIETGDDPSTNNIHVFKEAVQRIFYNNLKTSGENECTAPGGGAGGGTPTSCSFNAIDGATYTFSTIDGATTLDLVTCKDISQRQMKGVAFEPLAAGVVSGLTPVTLADACMVVTVDTDGKDKGDNKLTDQNDVHAIFKFYVFKNAIVTDEAGGAWLNGD